MKSVSNIILEAVQWGGLIAGILIAVAQLTGLSNTQNFIIYLAVFILGSITILNLSLYSTNRKRNQRFSYVPGKQAAFRELTRAVEEAQEFIWVTRFSRSSIEDQHEYFDATDRKLRGRGCLPVGSYRRIMNIDSCDKVLYAKSLLNSFYNSKNFYLKGTNDSQYFEIILIDHKWVFLAFHHPDHTGTVSALLSISDPGVVREWELIYESLWIDPDAYDLKTKTILTEQERDAMIQKVTHLPTIA